MSDLFEEPDDATPLAPAKRDALLQTWIMDRDDLNEAEQENIVKGAARAGKRRGKPADSAFIRSASFTNSSRGIRVGILILRMEGWRRKAYDSRAGELERLPAVYDHCAPTSSTTGLTNTLSGWHNIARRSPRRFDPKNSSSWARTGFLSLSTSCKGIPFPFRKKGKCSKARHDGEALGPASEQELDRHEIVSGSVSG
nr:hypothetical protein [Bradyrhizobium valentinum]